VRCVLVKLACCARHELRHQLIYDVEIVLKLIVPKAVLIEAYATVDVVDAISRDGCKRTDCTRRELWSDVERNDVTDTEAPVC
jgi:hypothetical protein